MTPSMFILHQFFSDSMCVFFYIIEVQYVFPLNKFSVGISIMFALQKTMLKKAHITLGKSRKKSLKIPLHNNVGNEDTIDFFEIAKNVVLLWICCAYKDIFNTNYFIINFFLTSKGFDQEINQ